MATKQSQLNNHFGGEAWSDSANGRAARRRHKRKSSFCQGNANETETENNNKSFTLLSAYPLQMMRARFEGPDGWVQCVSRKSFENYKALFTSPGNLHWTFNSVQRKLHWDHFLFIYFFNHFLLTTFIFGDFYFPSFFFSLFFTFVALWCHLYRPRQVLNAPGRKFLSDRQKGFSAESHLRASQALSDTMQSL